MVIFWDVMVGFDLGNFVWFKFGVLWLWLGWLVFLGGLLLIILVIVWVRFKLILVNCVIMCLYMIGFL